MPRTPSQYVANLLDQLARQLQADLGRNVVGLYVYGSLTQSAFDPRRSDVDCVAVIRRPVSAVVVSRLRTSFRRLSGRHSWMRRLQLTILIQRELLQFNGDGWLYQFGRLSRTGSDGNPIVWVNILESGRVVFGADPHTFVPPITPALMRAALEREIGYLRTELVTKRTSVWRRRAAYRRYAAVTACRVLYTLETGRVAPKRRQRFGRSGGCRPFIVPSSDARSRGQWGHDSSRWVPSAPCCNTSSAASGRAPDRYGRMSVP